MNVLVVGGAGYIGSHCVRQLALADHHPVVLDNLVFGHRAAVDGIRFYEGDLGDGDLVGRVLEKEAIEVVMHFAAFAYVGESVTDPLKYYENNLAKPVTLLRAMVERGVRRFIFSSTCATYGVPGKLPITEEEPRRPVNPYGQTKLDCENLLAAVSRAHGLSFAALRYFNAAGAAEDGAIGEDHRPETHLIPLLIEAVLGRRENVTVFGRDYPTDDGTCLRDYIHVDDLSRAHIAAIDLLAEPGQAHYFNLGTGRPHSVLEVAQAVGEVAGKNVPLAFGPRRKGDPPALFADASRARRELKWAPEYTELEDIVATAWRWHRDNPDGFGERE